MSARNIKREILQCLKNRLGVDKSAIVRSGSLIIPTMDREIFTGYWIDIFSKHGEMIISGGVRIYWTYFSEMDDRISAAAPYPTVPLKKWEMSAVLDGFEKLTNKWPNEGKCLLEEEGAAEICDEICNVSVKEAREYFNKYASVPGLFEYLVENGPDRPGTWRPTLEFLLRERLHGLEAACRHLQASGLENGTGYERHQMNWLLENRCAQ